ncbi:MAG: DUF1292 domain-containing protein [Eubacterium sp.]|nr:DUF1292 domain-containing protein [Eubacterium sp.]
MDTEERKDLAAVDETDDEIITLTDEDGTETDFIFIDLIPYDDKEYVCLIPADDKDEESGEVVILRVVPDPEDPDMEEYESVDDDEVLTKVYALFKEANSDLFDFED